MSRRGIKMSTLEEVIEKARNDPETKENGAVVYWHTGVGRYVYFCDHRFKVDYAMKILPGDQDV